ncbi:MAG: nucleotidyltransferase domain-containing protein [Kineosporiaceae bacterium]
MKKGHLEPWDQRLRLFGSAARGDDRPDSDVDLLVDLPDGMGIVGFGRLVEDFERVLGGIDVDLVPASDLKPGLREQIEREAIDL